MRHERAQRWFSRAVDQELSQRQQRRFAAHLVACPECRREYELFVLAHRTLARPETGSLSAGFTEELVARLRQEREQSRSTAAAVGAGRLRLVAGIAALVLLFLWGDRAHLLPELRSERPTSSEIEMRMMPWNL
ncbi:MAG: zf-HC2 domain-containing protein [Candidatus Latescibacterota bacterium]|jgi:anti-sigma factor RsiW